jgi:hypothetical protein
VVEPRGPGQPGEAAGQARGLVEGSLRCRQNEMTAKITRRQPAQDILACPSSVVDRAHGELGLWKLSLGEAVPAGGDQGKRSTQRYLEQRSFLDRRRRRSVTWLGLDDLPSH